LGGYRRAISLEEVKVKIESFIDIDKILYKLVEKFSERPVLLYIILLLEEVYIGFREVIAIP
jgi:hypothetical protein